ncbi:MAG: choice-of-anchor D domain-containing protein [Acidobacteria bacterium]|nr:choice-of-anchor D domain-containing protein [Acidobacteriota bacterium]MBI3425467.1 choice-of-anchor D domain-containing protein [Acidobacteriota bacterium]
MRFSFQGRSLPVSVLSLAVLLLACLALLFPNWFAPAQVTAQGVGKRGLGFTPAAQGSGFIISEQNGQRICQQATPAQAQQMRRAVDTVERKVIYAGRARASTAEQEQIGLRITLRASAQLDNFPDAKAAFIRAAQNWEAQILSPISIVLDVDFGPTFFGENYPNANIIGQTASQTIGSRTGYPNIKTALLAGASSSAETALYNALPTGQLPTDQGALAAVFADASVFRALGLISATANPDTEQQNLGSPPQIGFNSAFPFDFDPSNGINPNQIDFDATATHEIGHALGFGSNVGDKELDSTIAASVTVLDIFRFRPGINLASFSSAQRILASGGTQVFFGDGGVELGFSTGRADSTGGDRNQASHWKANELTGVYIGVMDPTAARGERDQITQNDLNAFDTIGYRVRSAQQQIDVTPATVDFGDVALNASADRTLSVLNTGAQTLQVTGLTLNNAQFKLTSSATTFTIAPNAQQNVVLRFTPTANGAQTGTLTLASNDPNRPTLSVSLNGFGGVQPLVALTSSTAQTGTIAAPPTANDCRIDPTQYTIQVPVNATQLRVTLSGNQDVDLYARFGQRVAGVSPNFTGDHVSDSPNNSEAITVTPSSVPVLRAGTYFIGVANCGPGTASYTVTATVTGGSTALATVSAASFSGAELTADSIASAFGQNLATANASATTNPLPSTLAGSTLKVRDSAGTERAASLFFVSSGQINFLVPTGTATGAATLTVTNSNGATAVGTINIAAVAPGLFAANANGQGVAAAVALRVHADGSQSFEAVARFDTTTSRFVSVPIDLGAASDQVFAVLFGTGIRNRSSLNAATALVGGVATQVQFAGAQGGQVGLDQVNVLLPRSLAGRSEVDVVLSFDGKTANTVRVNIK